MYYMYLERPQCILQCITLLLLLYLIGYYIIITLQGITVAEWLRNGKVGQPLRDPNRNNVIVSRGKNTSDVTAHVSETH